LSLEHARLHNLEHTVLHDMHEAYQALVANYELIRTQHDRRQSAAEQVLAQFEFYKQGKTTIDRVLDAQRRFADALRDEQQSIVGYNQSIANWEFAKGTILRNDNVVIAEELLSVADAKMIRQRSEQIEKSVVIPLHPGSKIHEDPRFPPDDFGPL